MSEDEVEQMNTQTLGEVFSSFMDASEVLDPDLDLHIGFAAGDAVKVTAKVGEGHKLKAVEHAFRIVHGVAEKLVSRLNEYDPLYEGKAWAVSAIVEMRDKMGALTESRNDADTIAACVEWIDAEGTEEE